MNPRFDVTGSVFTVPGGECHARLYVPSATQSSVPPLSRGKGPRAYRDVAAHLALCSMVDRRSCIYGVPCGALSIADQPPIAPIRRCLRMFFYPICHSRLRCRIYFVVTGQTIVRAARTSERHSDGAVRRSARAHPAARPVGADKNDHHRSYVHSRCQWATRAIEPRDRHRPAR